MAAASLGVLVPRDTPRLGCAMVRIFEEMLRNSCVREERARPLSVRLMGGSSRSAVQFLISYNEILPVSPLPRARMSAGKKKGPKRRIDFQI